MNVPEIESGFRPSFKVFTGGRAYCPCCDLYQTVMLSDGEWVFVEHPSRGGGPPDKWREAMGALKGVGPDEPAEVTIRRIRDGGDQ